ncbi:MAG: hypothetical protein E6Q97_29350 [Desulfurellales bacterium]|nr:MAG: hypothetical protein E6Q97_29350 [Desulfurellales bacterium]
MTLPYRLLIAALLGFVLLSMGAIGGYRYSEGRHAVADAKAQELRQALIDQQRAHEAQVAQTLEAKLSELQANQTVIERERLKIVDRPVYKNVCIDDQGLDLISKARAGK